MDKVEFCEKIASLAMKSILYEVAATPKPGLVDRTNSGAHNDMDFFTFMDSISILNPYFYRCTEMGLNFKGDNYKELLGKIRPIGIKAEIDMFNNTDGINTHKGIIFSQGILAAAVGSLYREDSILNLEILSNRIKRIAEGITDELNFVKDKDSPTYGEKLFIEHGHRGIRGEVQNGFPTVIKHSYPFMKKLIDQKKYHINDIMVQTLLYLIEHTQDSNILGRHNMDTLDFTKNSTKRALQLGGIFTKQGKNFINELDTIFIQKNISPGGSADLLSVTIMIYMILNGDISYG